MEESEVMYNSEFLPSVKIAVVFENNPQYETLKEYFDEYGYGFMVPGNNMVIIDGEQLVNGLGPESLKFIEAHEISHVIMGHDGPRNEDEELDADLECLWVGIKDDLVKNMKEINALPRN